MMVFLTYIGMTVKMGSWLHGYGMFFAILRIVILR
jgi:hypothetical protein